MRRIILTAILLIVSPTLACAWTITSKAMTTGGAITPVGTISLPSTTLSASYLVTPNANFSVAKVTLNGVTIGTNPGTYTVTKTTASSRTILAFFTKAAAVVTVTPASGGVVSATPTGNVQSGTTVNITAAPNYDYRVTEIKVNGTNILSGGPYAVNQTATASTVVTGPTNITASFAIVPRITASLFSSPSGTYVGSPSAIILDATNTVSNVQPLNYTFNVPAGFSVSDLVPPMNGKMLLTNATTAGSYAITVTAEYLGTKSTSSPVTITVRSANDEKSRICTSCHAGHDPDITSLYNSSKHMTVATGPACQDCHDPGMALPHPGIVRPVDSCQGCHVDGSGNVLNHLFFIGTNACTACHDPHSTAPGRMALPPPHYNNITSGMYPASYVTSRSSCTDCHSNATDNAAIRHAWGGSGHADTQDTPWTAQDFKTMDGCVRCHTTTGYINYIASANFTNTSAWGLPADSTKEVMSCKGCHNPDFSRRSVTLVGKTFTDSFQVNSGTAVSASHQYSGSYWIDSTSNICMPCHTAGINGELIKQAAVFADFTAVGRLKSHAMAAGGMIGKAVAVGYNYDETTYQNKHNTWHYYIGIGNNHGTGTGGPCVACHMNAPGKQHTFAVVSSNSNGIITRLAAQAICDGCHPSLYVAGPMDVSILTNRKAGFTDALAALKAQLQKSGFDPDRTASVNWGATSHIRANNMGAYYNYFLLRDGDKGAYVHGPAYTKRLIIASLNWLDDNTFNSSVYATLQQLATDGRISPATRDSVRQYLDLGPGDSKTGYCLNCHAS